MSEGRVEHGPSEKSVKKKNLKKIDFMHPVLQKKSENILFVNVGAIQAAKVGHKKIWSKNVEHSNRNCFPAEKIREEKRC